MTAVFFVDMFDKTTRVTSSVAGEQWKKKSLSVHQQLPTIAHFHSLKTKRKKERDKRTV